MTAYSADPVPSAIIQCDRGEPQYIPGESQRYFFVQVTTQNLGDVTATFSVRVLGRSTSGERVLRSEDVRIAAHSDAFRRITVGERGAEDGLRCDVVSPTTTQARQVTCSLCGGHGTVSQATVAGLGP